MDEHSEATRPIPELEESRVNKRKRRHANSGQQKRGSNWSEDDCLLLIQAYKEANRRDGGRIHYSVNSTNEQVELTGSDCMENSLFLGRRMKGDQKRL